MSTTSTFPCSAEMEPRFTFLSLPPELRLEVYKYLTPKSVLEIACTCGFHSNTRRICGLLFANQLIYSELSAIHWTSVTKLAICPLVNLHNHRFSCVLNHHGLSALPRALRHTFPKNLQAVGIDCTWRNELEIGHAFLRVQEELPYVTDLSLNFTISQYAPWGILMQFLHTCEASMRLWVCLAVAEDKDERGAITEAKIRQLNKYKTDVALMSRHFGKPALKLMFNPYLQDKTPRMWLATRKECEEVAMDELEGGVII